MVWVPYHLSGIWMGVLVSGQSFLQTITPHFSQSTVLDQSWSLTFSETITKSISVWTRLGTFLDLPDRLFCSSLLWKETKWTAEIKSTVCTETQPSDCIISAYWNTKGSWRSIKEKGTPSNAHALFVDPVASACILGEEIGHMLWKLKKEKKKSENCLDWIVLPHLCPFLSYGVHRGHGKNGDCGREQDHCIPSSTASKTC